MQLADAERVAALIRTAFSAIAVALDPLPSALRETAASVSASLTAGGGAVWSDAAMEGCILWRPVERGLYVGRLSVRPASRGRGIARALIDAAEAEACRRGLPRLLLEVRLALEDNRRLFAAAGFRETVQRAHPGYPAPTFTEAEKTL